MYCRKCGKSIPDDSLFCPYCGVATDPAVQKVKSGVRHFPIMIVLTLILGSTVLACILMTLRHVRPDRTVVTTVASEETAPPQSTVSTLPPETTVEETQTTDDSYPWRHVDSMEEAQAILGFGLEAPEIVKDFEAPWINVAPASSNLGASYYRYTQEHDPMYYDKIITVRRSIYIIKYPCPGGSIFVSDKAQRKLIKVDGHDVVLEMDGYEVVAAEWAADGYAYTLSFENMGLTASTVVPLIAQTH